MTERLVAAAAVLATIVACAGCSSSAPSPNPAPAPAPAPTPAPAQTDKQLAEDDLDGDNTGDAVIAVPKSAELSTFTSMRVVAGSGQTLLTLTNADGDIDGVFIAPVPGAPTPVLIVNRVGPTRDELMTPYLYDQATQQMVALQWASKEQQSAVLQGKVELDPDGHFVIWEHYWDGKGWQSRGDWVYRDGKLVPRFEN